MLGLIIPLGVPGAPGAPDNALPGQPGHISGQPVPGGRPDNTLPGGGHVSGQPVPGGRPDNTLPQPGGRPDQGVPHDEAWLLAYSPRNGYSWIKASDIVGSGHRPSNELPGGPPGHASGQPVPGGEHPSGQPVPGQPARPDNQPPGAQPKR